MELIESQVAPANYPVLIMNKPVRRISLEVYLLREERNEGRTERHEFHDGQLIKVPMAKGPHNIVIPNVSAALKFGLKKLNQNFILFSGQQKVYSVAENSAFYPDLLVVCEEPVYWDDGQLLLINPLLIAEIASPSTRKYDREGKFDLYKSIPSFREYLLVRPDKCRVETRFREEPGLWRDTIQTDFNGQIALRSVGVSLALADIYENVLAG